MKVLARLAAVWWTLTVLAIMVIATVNIWSPGKSPVEQKLVDTWVTLGLVPAVVMAAVLFFAAI